MINVLHNSLQEIKYKIKEDFCPIQHILVDYSKQEINSIINVPVTIQEVLGYFLGIILKR